jgi:[ribosomal protein S5]-alanine N-acetyltransferase
MSLRERLGGFPELETQRLRLRKVQPEQDAPAHYQLWSDPAVLEFTPDSPGVSPADSVVSLQRVAGWYLSARQGIGWAVTLKGDDRYIGGIGFYEFSGHGLQIGEISFTLLREHWNKGLATEALREVVKFGFTNLQLQRIQLMTHPQHQAAIRVAQKAGFQDEGLLRQYVYNERTGTWEDQRMFAILRTEREAPAT